MFNNSLSQHTGPLAGFRLRRLEMLNWGTFDSKVSILAPEGRWTLLVGDNGTGKSTAVDAFEHCSYRRVCSRAATTSPGKEVGFKRKADRSKRSYIRGAWTVASREVLSYFNADTGNMEVRVANDPTSLGDAPVTTVVQHDEWPEPAESLPPQYDNRLAQPYGGYISPGSTLDELRIFVSQWDTRARVSAPYRVIQFAVNPFKPD